MPGDGGIVQLQMARGLQSLSLSLDTVAHRVPVHLSRAEGLEETELDLPFGGRAVHFWGSAVFTPPTVQLNTAVTLSHDLHM